MEAVILFPAVDLKNGQCVRLEQGDMARATVFNLDPAAQARAFAGQGFEYLHVVDLDGAFAGKPVNASAVDGMLASLKIPHMGWNTLDMVREHPVLERLPLGPKGRHAYFVHSYHLNAANEAEVLLRADYGGPVTAIVGRDTAIGTQFHAEKSQRFGLALISNFLKWKP